MNQPAAKATETESKPLVLAEIMAGMDNLYDSAGSTRFTVTQECKPECRAQAVWLAQQMPQWVALLNENSGAIVTSYRVKYDVKKYGSGQSYIDSALIVDLELPGGLKLENIEDEEFRQVQSGQIRKLLAERVLKNFPPPFEYWSGIGLALNWPVTYRLNRISSQRQCETELFKKIDPQKLRQDLREFLQGLGAELIAYEAGDEICQDWWKLVVKWPEVVNDGIKEFWEPVRQFFQNRHLQVSHPSVCK